MISFDPRYSDFPDHWDLVRMAYRLRDHPETASEGEIEALANAYLALIDRVEELENT